MYTHRSAPALGFHLALAVLAVALLVSAGGCPNNLPADLLELAAGSIPDSHREASDDGAQTGDGSDNGSGDDPTDGDGNADDPTDGDGSGDPSAPGDPNGGGSSDADMCTLTVNTYGRGTVSQTTGEYERGSELTLLAEPFADWRFARWEDDLSGEENEQTITLNEDMSVGAVFLSFATASVQHHTVFDRVLDTDEMDNPYNFKLARMNTSGTKIFVTNDAGTDQDRKGMVLNDLAGLSRQEFDLPDGNGQIRFLAVAGNGSRAYMTSGYEDQIYKWDCGEVTTIDVSGSPGPGTIIAMETTDLGDHVFLLDERDVWRVNADGSGLVKLIDARAMPVADGTGNRIYDMHVDDSGTNIALLHFVVHPTGHNAELFIWDSGKITQLTDDRAGIHSKASVRICPHGQTIIYQDMAAAEYVAMTKQGLAKRSLAPLGYNFGGMALSDTGSWMVYNDARARGGKLVQTSGMETREIMPYSIPLSITNQLYMTDDARRIMFVYIYARNPVKQAVYVGHLYNDPIGGAPTISHARTSPPTMPRSGSGENAVIEFVIADAQGPDDIVVMCADEMANGVYVGEDANSPAAFSEAPHDDGEGGDLVAGNGRYSCLGRPRANAGKYNEVTIRIGVKDASETITVGDIVLKIAP